MPMTAHRAWTRFRTPFALVALVAAAAVWTAHVEAAPDASAELAASFEKDVRPFLKQHCLQCHNDEARISGVEGNRCCWPH